MSGAKGAFQAGILDLSLAIPKLPRVKFPSGREVQIQHFTAEGYEMFRRLRKVYVEVMQGGDDADRVDEMMDLIDELLRLVLPGADEDDLASLGVRVEARLAPIYTAAGEVDHVVAMLAEVGNSEGKATAE